MALTATIHNIDVDLSDVDRGVYTTLALKVARHPSESAEYLVTRVLAFALRWTEAHQFTQGVSTVDEPAIWARDLTGQLVDWVEIGTPDAARLHKAQKASPRVAVYCHKDPAPWLRTLAGQRVHQPDRIEIYAVDRRLVAALAAVLQKRMRLGISVTEGQLYVDIDGATHDAELVRLPFPG